MILIKELNQYRSKDYQSAINCLITEAYDKVNARMDTTLLDLLSSSSGINSKTYDIKSLDPKRIYDLNTIKSLCIDYRLRFLSSSLYKADFPEQVLAEINFIKDQTKIKFDDFFMIAPAEVFSLKNYDDPLLFANLGNGYYYYITQWGNDLSNYRKLKYWPVRNFENLVLTLFVLSALLTLVYQFSFGNLTDYGKTFIMILFTFKSLIAITGYIIISRGFNLSTSSWNSKYFNH